MRSNHFKDYFLERSCEKENAVTLLLESKHYGEGISDCAILLCVMLYDDIS